MPQQTLIERLLASLLIGILFFMISHSIFQSAKSRGARSGVKLEVLNRAAVASTDPYTPPAVPVAEVELRFPPKMKISETLPVKALLYPKGGGFKLSTPTEATLESPSFEISSSTAQPAVHDFSNLDHLEWNWLIVPKTLGSHLLTLRIVEHGGNTITLQPIVASLVTLDRNTAMAHIEVVNELGWSAWWAALFSIAISLVGAVLTFLALPLLGSVMGRFFTRSSSTPPDP